MYSRQGLADAVDLCAQYGFNSLFVCTWNNGYTLYPSAVMEAQFGEAIDPRLAGRDPLQELIELAEAKQIKVYAWFEFGFSSSYQEADGGHLLRRKPHWAAKDSAGDLVSKNGFQWMNAFDPEVQNFVLSLLKEVAETYEVAGIQGDDRLPALPSTAGYDSLTVALYQAEHQGNAPPQDYRDADWVDWRAKRLNDFLRRMHDELKALKPELAISVSPSIFPWSKEEYLQDWPTWVDSGWVDMACPQIYRYDIGKYRLELAKIVQQQVAPENHAKLFPGILLKVGSYYASPELLAEMVAENRKYGLEGEIFFFYEGLKRHPDFFQQLYAK
jgi:uncharacterized lipoprotein YddW (UPF0748 family)